MDTPTQIDPAKAKAFVEARECLAVANQKCTEANIELDAAGTACGVAQKELGNEGKLGGYSGFCLGFRAGEASAGERVAELEARIQALHDDGVKVRAWMRRSPAQPVFVRRELSDGELARVHGAFNNPFISSTASWRAAINTALDILGVSAPKVLLYQVANKGGGVESVYDADSREEAQQAAAHINGSVRALLDGGIVE